MVDHSNPNHDDLLERATRALSQAPVPEGPPEELVADALGALEELEETAGGPRIVNLKERVFAMKPRLKIAVAAAVLVACCILIGLLAPRGGAALALDRVADALANIQSGTCRMKTTAEGQPDRTGKALYLAPSRERLEWSTGGVMILNSDPENRKSLFFEPEKKFAVVTDLENVPAGEGPTNSFDKLRQQVRDAQSRTSSAERLGKRQIDGQEVIGFRITTGAFRTDIWADPQTALPVRTETETRMRGQPTLHIVMSDFRFNVELDESLFSLDPPEGYTVQELKLDVSGSTDHRLAETLRFLAEENDGVFPARFLGMGVGAAARHAELVAKHGKDSPEVMKALVEREAKMAGGLAFRMTLPPESDWHYDGKDVRLDTPDRAIFWYKPVESETYRVIYADLTIKDVAPDDVPKALGEEEAQAAMMRLVCNEEEWVRSLRFLAEESGGVFPPSLLRLREEGVMASRFKELVAKHGKDSPQVRKWATDMEAKMGKGLMFLQNLPPESDWHYDGKGVKPDTPDRAIFWYKPAESETYRVVYADLTVKDVAPGDLPEAADAERAEEAKKK